MQAYIVWKQYIKIQHIVESLSCILNILWVVDLSSVLFNTSCGISSIPQEWTYTTVFLSINNETQCVALHWDWDLSNMLRLLL